MTTLSHGNVLVVVVGLVRIGLTVALTRTLFLWLLVVCVVESWTSLPWGVDVRDSTRDFDFGMWDPPFHSLLRPQISNCLLVLEPGGLVTIEGLVFGKVELIADVREIRISDVVEVDEVDLRLFEIG